MTGLAPADQSEPLSIALQELLQQQPVVSAPLIFSAIAVPFLAALVGASVGAVLFHRFAAKRDRRARECDLLLTLARDYDKLLDQLRSLFDYANECHIEYRSNGHTSGDYQTRWSKRREDIAIAHNRIRFREPSAYRRNLVSIVYEYTRCHEFTPQDTAEDWLPTWIEGIASARDLVGHELCVHIHNEYIHKASSLGERAMTPAEKIDVRKALEDCIAAIGDPETNQLRELRGPLHPANDTTA